MQPRVGVDTDQFDASDLREVFEMLHRERLAETRMMCTTSVDPCSGSDIETWLGLPYGACDGKLRQLVFRRNHVDLIDDQAKSIPHVHDRGDHSRALGCCKNKTNRIGLAADSESLDFQRRLVRGDRWANLQHV